MPQMSTASPGSTNNPLDLIEEIAAANEWLFDRTSDEELVGQLNGRWSEYRLMFSWSQDMSALQMTCLIDVRVPHHRRQPVNELLALANERLWLGHFDLGLDNATPMFRHTVPLRGVHGASVEQLEDLMDIALNECDRFYPAFHYVVWGGKDPTEAIAAACLDPVGEA
jgi:hypothetical protein